MNINYKDFETDKLSFIKGSPKKETPQIQIPPATIGGGGWSFDPISEDQCEQMGREAGKIFFGNSEGK